MTAESDPESVLRRVRDYGQGHVLRFWDSLDEAGRASFLDELAGLDFNLIEELRGLVGTPPTDLSFSDVQAPPVERLPLSDWQQRAERRVVRLGQRALRKDRVAALTVAGGQGTRLDYDRPKGTYPITPIRRLSLFAYFAEQILAARRRYGCRMPWLIMTASSNDAETRRYFAENAFFGLGEESVFFFTQSTNPILDRHGRLLLADKGRILSGPDGHGGVYTALSRSGLLTMLRSNHWDLLSYFQVDNPLAPVADPRFIGHHLHKGADFSAKVVPKRDPSEGLGLVICKAGQPVIVEYSDVPQDVAGARIPSGKLRFTYGSIAMHVLSLAFVEQMVQQDVLPWHVARRQYSVVGDDGLMRQTEPGECCKFERFVFDALPLADSSCFVEVRRDTEFAPVKNAEGEDSPDSARRAMQRMWVQWLRAAGARVEIPKDFSQPAVEISPLFAADQDELRERIEPGRDLSLPLLLEA